MTLSNFIKRYSGNPAVLFLFRALALYVAWYVIYEIWLHPSEIIDVWIVRNTLGCALLILKFFGYHVFSGSDRLMGIDGTNGLWMGDNCNSLELCALYTGFILAFPGGWKRKIWFVPLGVILIFYLNVMRVVALAVIQKNFSPELLNFNHTYTFTILVYGFIFFLWYRWVRMNISIGKSKVPANGDVRKPHRS